MFRRMAMFFALMFTVVFLTGLEAGAVTQVASSRLFGTTGVGSGTSTLVELNPITGALIRTIGPVGYLVNGLDYDPVSGKMYASTSGNDVTFPRGLLTINISTGAGTPVGSGFGLSENVTNIRADSTGALFGWVDPGSDDLAAINPLTGTASFVGESGMGTGAYGMSFNSAGTLYFVNYDGSIYTVNTLTGAGTFTGISAGTTAHHGDFNPDTDKYWGISSPWSTQKYLQVINVATGAVEQTLPTVDNLHTIAFMPICKVGVYYADGWPVDVQNKINATGLFSQVDLHNVGSTTPTLTELQGYDSVLVYSNSSFANSTALGNVLADYADAGGGVVMATFAFWNPGYGYGLAISGRILNDGYLPFTVNSQSSGTSLSLVPDLVSHPILSGVTSFNGGSSSYHNTITLAAGATQVAHWNNGTPLVATKQQTTGKIVGLNFFPPSSDARGDFWDTSTDGGRLMGNALNWACGGGSVNTTFIVTPTAGAGGSIDPSTPQTVNANETTSFTVTPNTGYHIANVSGCGGNLSGNTYTTGPITSNCTVNATFAINTYTVTPSAGAGGSLSPSTPQTVNYNQTTSFTAIPNPHYHLVSVSGCGGSLSGNVFTTGAITSACTVSATFAIDTFAVTPVAGAYGTISPAIPQIVDYSQTTSFTVTPEKYFRIDTVSGCNGSLNGTVYTTGPITAACTVEASFYPTRITPRPAFLTVTPQSINILNGGYVYANWGSTTIFGAVYELEQSTNGGAFVQVYKGQLKSWKALAKSLGKGTYVYRVRAVAPKYAPSSWLTALPVTIR